MLRVVTLSTLFPDEHRPNFGVFVERSVGALAAMPDTQVTVVAGVGVPPWPLSLAPRYWAPTRLPAREAWHGLDVRRPRFTVLPGTGGRWHVPALVRAVRPVFDELWAGQRFDVIDASFFFPDGPAAVALGKRYGVPVSIKARGADIHHWGHASATRAQVLAAGRAADGLLAVGDALKADMVALGMPGGRIGVHRTGVDAARFHPRDRAAAKAALGLSGPVLLSLGALIPRKGHHIAIEALAALPDATLLIAGEGPERAALVSLAARLGVASRVRLLGSVAHDDLPALIAAADAMALASSSEGLANAWIESLACGTPIVVTDAGSAREVVTSAAAGRIAARHPAAFAAAIRALLADPPSREAVAATAAGYSWTANGAGLRDHLARLVQASSG